MASMDTPKASNTKLSVSLDLRIVVVVLLAIIVAMVIAWKPWDAQISANSRTVKVTGETTIKSEPDEYVFYPNYQFKNADKQVALGESNKKNAEVVAKLKELGVSDSKIKTNTNGFGGEIYYSSPDGSKDTTYTLSLTVTVGTKDLAQKVQDYLNETSPTGSVSPQATFSTAKRKTLESQARTAAIKDAKAKADQNAENLGFKVGKVKEVTDGQGFEVMPMMGRGSTMELKATDASLSSPSIQPGENEIPYSVTVTYFLK